MSKQLKMFVWEDVLRDYTAGMVCILAYDLEHAKEIAERDFEPYVVENFFGKPHQVVTEPKGFYVYGGG